MNRNINFSLVILFLSSYVQGQMKFTDYIEQSNARSILEIMDSMINNRPDFFYSKIHTEFSSTNPDFGAEMRLSTRVKKDSLIFSNANYMGIQAASIHLTKEKGSVLNRFSKCFMEGDAKLISNFTGVDLELLELEELLLGLPVYYTKLDKSLLKNSIDSLGNVQVTFSGNIRTSSLEQKWVDLTYVFDDSLTYLKQLNLNVQADSLTLTWKCEEYQDVSGFRVPFVVSVNTKKSESVIELSLKYNSVEINVPEIIEFEIPENYEKCN